MNYELGVRTMKTMFLGVLIFVFLWNSMDIFAQIDQHNSEWMHYLEERMEEEDESFADLYEELSNLVENPYNLQTVSKEELEKLPFLTALQIENLLYYIYKYGPLVDIYELKNVEDLDLQTITYLLPFVYVGEAKTTDPVIAGLTRNPLSVLQYSKQELMLRTNFTVQEKAGYTDKKYLGDPYYLGFRYGFNYRDKIQWGISGEKDPGEPVWNAYNKGFDYYTFNLTLKDAGVLEALHFGNYRLSFGQGLVMNTNFSMGKTSDVVNINQKNAGIQRHVSTNESQYFSGTAGTLHKNNVRLSLFYSNRNQDATVDDTTVYTFKTDGYHRTYGDWQKRETVCVEMIGSNVQWQKDRFSVGLTGIRYSFGGKALNPDWKPYNVFYLRGKEHFNTGLNYGYQTKKGSLQGETAMDNSGKIASIHNLLLKPASFIDWAFSFRYYDKQYNALYGKSLSESGTIQNETGLYSGMKIRMFRQWELSAYLDYFIFPWLKYGIDTPSSGKDVLVQLKYNLRPDLQMNLRYKWKEKYTDSAPYEQHRWRYQLNYTLHNVLKFHTQADYTIYKEQGKTQQAWSGAQSVSYIPASAKFQLDGGLAYFHTGDWNTRISAYEKNILYAFSFPTYYGHGLRYYAVLKWKMAKPLTVYLKCGSTHYFDRTVISSGPEAIQGKEKTDVYCLIKYNF
ncbi:hypothetical protein FACS189421_09160 [Bacteroidia bacterium]|nr:hypothetical protein FACS189421_09160 [Bacteroidia bacterium]GHT04852.1 hypothetical protein FACS189423_08170 [Bacteroidia bacterium]GHT50530.1 hypothetical protein FACS189440_18100 [Bacteroidia bacterium]